MSVYLRYRNNKDGSKSIRLDIYSNGFRWIETLKNIKLVKPCNPQDRLDNKEKKRLANQIRIDRELELEANNYNIENPLKKKTPVITWMDSFVQSYDKSDKRNIQGAVNKFKLFLHKKNYPNLFFNNLSISLIESFIDFLVLTCKGEGANSYFSRFKKIIKIAHREGYLKVNPILSIDKKPKGKARQKDILTIAELHILFSLPLSNENVRKAFLFCCCTGLRYCDIKFLKGSNIDLNKKTASIVQSKTKIIQIIKLNRTALELIGTPNGDDTLIFELPSANGSNKLLKKWVKKAGINKKITWHCARHTFGTNLIDKNIDIFTTSKLLGHTSVKHTHRYVRESERLTEFAVDAINFGAN